VRHLARELQYGITTQGISQGAEIALLAANYSSQVKAVYALSAGDHFDNVYNFPLPCMDKANTFIPANRLTVVNGISNPFFGGQSHAQNVSGISCADASHQCWSPDGSGAGWYIVQDWQNAAGLANQCYMFDNIGNNVYSCGGPIRPELVPTVNLRLVTGAELGLAGEWYAPGISHPPDTRIGDLKESFL
jgi:hypothetical protein